MTVESAPDLTAAILSLCPPGVSFGLRSTMNPLPPLWSPELPAAATMGPKRLREFTAGRACAREALAAVGVAPCAIPVGPGRAPVWPQGVVGSISHHHELAMAMAARETDFLSLGVDLESAEPLENALTPRICRPEEWASLAGDDEPGVSAKLVFSAKESVYKCLWPVTGVFLEFHEISIRLDPERGQFTAIGHGAQASGLPVHAIRGTYRRIRGLLTTCAWLT